MATAQWLTAFACTQCAQSAHCQERSAARSLLQATSYNGCLPELQSAGGTKGAGMHSSLETPPRVTTVHELRSRSVVTTVAQRANMVSACACDTLDWTACMLWAFAALPVTSRLLQIGFGRFLSSQVSLLNAKCRQEITLTEINIVQSSVRQVHYSGMVLLESCFGERCCLAVCASGYVPKVNQVMCLK